MGIRSRFFGPAELVPRLRQEGLRQSSATAPKNRSSHGRPRGDSRAKDKIVVKNREKTLIYKRMILRRNNEAYDFGFGGE